MTIMSTIDPAEQHTNNLNNPDVDKQNSEENLDEELNKNEILFEADSKSKIIKQGPWIHPFPLIVGISIAALLVSLFSANILINRFSEQLSKTDYYHSPPNLAQLIVDIQKSTMVVHCGDALGSGWVIALGEVVASADEETKKLDKDYPGSVITNYHVIKDCIKNPKSIRTSNGSEDFE